MITIATFLPIAKPVNLMDGFRTFFGFKTPETTVDTENDDADATTSSSADETSKAQPSNVEDALEEKDSTPAPTKIRNKPAVPRTRTTQPKPTKKRSRSDSKAQVEIEAAIEEEEIENLDLLKQPNGWECGYYSVFHYLATKKSFTAKRKSPIKDSQYRTFIKNLLKLDENIKELYDDEEYLGGHQIEQILQFMGGDLNEVLVIDEQHISGIIPTDSNIIKKINRLRRRNAPFWALVCTKRPAHWVCLTFLGDESCIGIDSLHGNRTPDKQPILVTIKNLCLGIVPLPTSAQFLTTYRNYHGIQDVPRNSDAYQENYAVIEADALHNGFTQETFEALVAHLEWRYRIDHRQHRGPRKAIVIS